MNGFGILVTTNGESVGDSADYSCWPGYSYIKGNLNRTCMPMLIWSGRRPACQLQCPSTLVVAQKCKQCEGETSSDSECSPKDKSANINACPGKLNKDRVVSIAKVGNECEEYECRESIAGWTGSTGDWMATETCAKGSVSSLIHFQSDWFHHCLNIIFNVNGSYELYN